MTTFAQRLQMACADHPDIPDYGKGLQTELAKQMKVSQEAVRKWLSGESTPRQPAMIRLAKFLGVEYVWLALGTSETEFENMKQFMGASLHIFIYITFLIIISTLTISFYLPELFGENSQYIEIFQVLLLLAGVQSIFALLGTAYGGVVTGYQRYEINAGIEISVILIRAGLIVYFLPDFPNLYTMAVAHFSITILGFLVTVLAARKIAPVKQLPILKKPSKDILRIILKYNSVSFAVSGLAILGGYLDTIIVGSLISLAAVTHYGVGSRLITYCYNFLRVTTRVIAPAISELDATDKHATLNAVLIATHKASCLFAYPVLFCLIFQGEEFILLWMGNGFEDSYQIMKIMALAAFFIAPTMSINSYLYAIGKHKYLLYIMISEMMVSIPLAIFLSHKYGAIGIALGFSIPGGISRSIIFPLLINNITRINMFVIFIRNKLRILIASLPFITVLLFSKNYHLLDSWVNFSIQLFVASIVFLFSAYFIGLKNDEKQKLNMIFEPIWKRLTSGGER